MRGAFQLKNPDAMEATLSLTMTVREWKNLRDQLPTAYPSWKLGSLIEKTVGSASLIFHEEQVEADL